MVFFVSAAVKAILLKDAALEKTTSELGVVVSSSALQDKSIPGKTQSVAQKIEKNTALFAWLFRVINTVYPIPALHTTLFT